MIFGFPNLKVPVVDGEQLITRAWHMLLVQMANILGTVNFGQATGVLAGTAASIISLTNGQAIRVLTFDSANSANNATANVFYDGTTLTISNIVLNGAGVTIQGAGAIIQVKNTSGGTLSINWRTA